MKSTKDKSFSAQALPTLFIIRSLKVSRRRSIYSGVFEYFSSNQCAHTLINLNIWIQLNSDVFQWWNQYDLAIFIFDGCDGDTVSVVLPLQVRDDVFLSNLHEIASDAYVCGQTHRIQIAFWFFRWLSAMCCAHR